MYNILIHLPMYQFTFNYIKGANHALITTLPSKFDTPYI